MPCGPVRIRAASVRCRTDTPNNLDGRRTDNTFDVRAAAARTPVRPILVSMRPILSVRCPCGVRATSLLLIVYRDYQFNRLSVRQRYSIRAASVQ